MATNDERMMILNMIQENKISAEEGTRLLTALGGADENPPAGDGSPARFMRIRVTDTVTGQQKVSVNLPMALVTFGLRFVPESSDIDKEALRAAIESGYTGRLVDVQDNEDGTHVEIFLE